MIATKSIGFIANGLFFVSLLFSHTVLAQTLPDGDSTTFQDWLIKCTPVEKDNQPIGLECTMSQYIEFEDNSEPLLRIDLYLNPSNRQPEAVFVLPLGIPLNTPPILSFDNMPSKPIAISHCHSDGCYFKAPLSKRFLEAFLSMRTGQLTLSGTDNEMINIPISGAGSRSAYNYFDALPKD